jgi:hypothetical protein
LSEGYLWVFGFLILERDNCQSALQFLYTPLLPPITSEAGKRERPSLSVPSGVARRLSGPARSFAYPLR